MLPASGQGAFGTPTRSNSITFCGAGALAIPANFATDAGSATTGDVVLPLPGAPVDLTGQSITVNVLANPGCSASLSLAVIIHTVTGDRIFPVIRPLTASWQTMTYAVSSATGGDITQAMSISLHSTEFSGYQGTIYVDEIDLQ